MISEFAETWRALCARPRRAREVCFRAVHAGHDFLVVIRGPRPARFLVDGRQVDSRSPLLALERGIPLLSCRLGTAHPGVSVAEVYLSGPRASRVTLRVDGVTLPMMRELDRD